MLSVDLDRSDPASVIVTLSGELDIATCDTLQEVLADIADVASVTVDLRGLEFMDSSGVHCLLDAHRAARDRGVEFKVIDGASVSRVLEVSGVRPHLDFVEASAEQRP